MISILIPIYNEIELIDESVNSVLAQTFEDWELIIGINGQQSSLEIHNIANKYASDKVKVIDLNSFSGKGNLLNEMVKYCKYDWIAILEIGYIWYPEKLQKQMEHISDYDVIATKCQDINIPVGDITDIDFLAVNPIINSSFVMKKKLCYWENINEVEDYNMWLRLRYVFKVKMYNIDEVLIKQIIHKESIFNNSVYDLIKKYTEKQNITTSINLKGGLGNQLFQIFTLISYSIDNSRPFCLINVKVLGRGNEIIRHTFYDTFLSRLQKYLVGSEKINRSFKKLSETGFRYDKLPSDNYNKNIILDGYFQSPLYFDKNYEYIMGILNINNLQKELYQKEEHDYKNTVSMHFRLGDYKFKQNYHNILPKTYYTNSLNYVINSLKQNSELPVLNVLYFCEDEDIDIVNSIINEIKNCYTNITFIRANPKLSDWEQLLLMSLCSHNIIANSSYSWWGAYFNNNKNKLVCYPSVWFGPFINVDTQDLFPSTWSKINII